ncbi:MULTISPECIES: hypothetical protein [unclassified Kitasatospora]|uniref:hypothetical protein n=1 Tax=unclassified Kitasatospora TaxID=2633591 RepID=UPI0033EF2BBC
MTTATSTATTAPGRDGTEARSTAADGSSANDRTRVPETVSTDRIEPRQSMTCLADAVGVMVSEQAEQTREQTREQSPEQDPEQTRVLRAHARTPESRSSTLVQHSRFLESLLAGQAVLQEERRPEGR